MAKAAQSNKQLFTFILLFVIVAALIAGLSQIGNRQDSRSSAAVPDTFVGLSMSTANIAPDLGETFDVDVTFESGNLHITGIGVTLNYDTSILEATGCTNSGILPQVLGGPGATINNEGPVGSANYILGASAGNPIQGTHVFMTCSFEVISAGSTDINFSVEGKKTEVITSEFLDANTAPGGTTNRFHKDGVVPLNIAAGNVEPTDGVEPTDPPTTGGRFPGDCDNNGSVELDDFGILVATFNTTVEQNTGCDFSGGPDGAPDGKVGLADFNALVRNFGLSVGDPTNTPAPTIVTNPTNPPPPTGGLEFEAESGQLNGGMTTNGGFISAPGRHLNDPHAGGSAIYSVNIPEAGQYIVQMLVCPPDIDHNSVFVEFDRHPDSDDVFDMDVAPNCSWQTVNRRGSGGGENNPEFPTMSWSLTPGTHELHVHAREEVRMDKMRIVREGDALPTDSPPPTQGPLPTIDPNLPTSTPFPTNVPGQISKRYPFGVLSDNTKCGKYPNAKPNCIAVSFQDWLDNVPASDRTFSPNYTPRLCHWHSDYNVPWNENGTPMSQVPVRFVEYNCHDPIDWIRIQDQGSTTQQIQVRDKITPCQNGKYEGKECHTEYMMEMSSRYWGSGTEARISPNANNADLAGGGRWYNSTNFQTGTNYRKNWELTNRHNFAPCGEYQRTILKNIDKYLNPGESMPTISGTVSIPFKTNGGCGDRIESLVYLDAKQHKGAVEGAQEGHVIFRREGHFDGEFVWDTTAPLPDGSCLENGVHDLLFVNLEGTSKYTGASNINLLYNVQNPGACQ